MNAERRTQHDERSAPTRYNPGVGRTRLVILISCATALTTAWAGRAAPAGADGAPAVLISRQLADALHLTAGAPLRLSPDSSGANARDFRVAGIYEPVADPMRINAPKHEVRLHLPDLLGMTADPADPLSAGGRRRHQCFARESG